jgi:hypothetical protein
MVPSIPVCGSALKPRLNRSSLSVTLRHATDKRRVLDDRRLRGRVAESYTTRVRADAATRWGFENPRLAEMTLPIVVAGDARMDP